MTSSPSSCRIGPQASETSITLPHDHALREFIESVSFVGGDPKPATYEEAYRGTDEWDEEDSNDGDSLTADADGHRRTPADADGA